MEAVPGGAPDGEVDLGGAVEAIFKVMDLRSREPAGAVEGVREAGGPAGERGAGVGDAVPGVVTEEGGGVAGGGLAMVAEGFGHRGLEAEGLLVEALLVAVDAGGEALTGAGESWAGESFAKLEELEAGGAVEAAAEVGEVVADAVLGFGDELGGGGGGGGAEVGDEIGDGEVGFVADGGDDGEAGGGDGAGDAFGVEGGEVFQRPSAAGEDDEIREFVEVDEGECGFDFGGGGFALNGYWDDEDVEGGVAAVGDRKEVADDGAGGRSDDGDGAGEGGEGLFAVFVEEALGFEAVAELLEGELEGACADGFEGVGDELELAALLVDGDFAADADVEAVLGAEAEEDGLAAEEDDGKLGFRVLEGKVDVAGGSGAEVGDFALDPDVAEVALDEVAGLGNELADEPGAAGGARLVEEEAELGRGWGGALHLWKV